MKSRDADRNQVNGVEDDAKLFDQAVSDVKPLQHKLATLKRVRPSPIPAAPASPEIATEFGEELRYLRPGIQTSALQKLRRGQFRIEATLDLHGLRAAEASEQLQSFLRQSQSSGRNAVRIVHGKGYGSEGRQPVLKTMVYQLLQEFSSVLAFCSARQQDGGTGAVDVLLRRAKGVR
jgi:DNA-nicking Smr family endonuclease